MCGCGVPTLNARSGRERLGPTRAGGGDRTRDLRGPGRDVSKSDATARRPGGLLLACADRLYVTSRPIGKHTDTVNGLRGSLTHRYIYSLYTAAGSTSTGCAPAAGYYRIAPRYEIRTGPTSAARGPRGG